MPDWNVAQGLKIDHEGVTPADSGGVGITANASANVKGSYTQIVASTARTTSWLIWHLKPNALSVDYLVDLAIGAGGSEQIIVPNLLLSNGAGFFFDKVLPLPLSIPSGTRIAARCQASTGNSSLQTTTYLGARPFPISAGWGLVVDYGTATADSGGTSIDPGAVANTKGSWTEIVASTTRLHRYLVVALGSQVNTVRSTAQWHIDVGIGAAGSEQVLIPNIYAYAHTTGDLLAPALIAFPVMIPPATRLAVRAQCDITDATDRLFDIALYGM